MGRGRAKAKQTKVARKLKYETGTLDPDALRAELASGGSLGAAPSSAIDEVDDEDEDYVDAYADDDED